MNERSCTKGCHEILRKIWGFGGAVQAVKTLKNVEEVRNGMWPQRGGKKITQPRCLGKKDRPVGEGGKRKGRSLSGFKNGHSCLPVCEKVNPASSYNGFVE